MHSLKNKNYGYDCDVCCVLSFSCQYQIQQKGRLERAYHDQTFDYKIFCKGNTVELYKLLFMKILRGNKKEKILIGFKLIFIALLFISVL